MQLHQTTKAHPRVSFPTEMSWRLVMLSTSISPTHCAAATHANCEMSLLACCLTRLPPDPPYGHAQNFRPAPELGRRVYAFHPSTGAVSVVAEGFVMPNGIAFAPDFKTLYVTDTGKENVSTGRD